LTVPQAQLLRRFTSRAVLSFDPDAAGLGAATRSCDLLVGEGFDVRVAVLPPGGDPDTFVREQGADAYRQLVDEARSWLDYLLDRAVSEHAVDRVDGRQAFIQAMLQVAARIPDAATRDQFADRIAHRGRITEEVVRAEIRKAAVARKTAPAAIGWAPGLTNLKPAERDLLAALAREPGEVVSALAELEEADLDGLQSATILREARAAAASGTLVPRALLERLNEQEARLLTSLAAGSVVSAPPVECVRALRVVRLQRERADVQREIDRLQELGAGRHAGQIEALWQRKKDLLLQLQAL
jgi:DNA primase